MFRSTVYKAHSVQEHRVKSSVFRSTVYKAQCSGAPCTKLSVQEHRVQRSVFRSTVYKAHSVQERRVQSSVFRSTVYKAHYTTVCACVYMFMLTVHAQHTLPIMYSSCIYWYSCSDAVHTWQRVNTATVFYSCCRVSYPHCTHIAHCMQFVNETIEAMKRLYCSNTVIIFVLYI